MPLARGERQHVHISARRRFVAICRLFPCGTANHFQQGPYSRAGLLAQGADVSGVKRHLHRLGLQAAQYHLGDAIFHAGVHRAPQFSRPMRTAPGRRLHRRGILDLPLGLMQ